eukprot:TRINITY_DN3656_c0_g1_i1.p1 TRINITY_DN3656_c0_g1~~TRINITY_DN3656_c0_g1_i1.p1  ORF type:complete len:129 (-),score=16.17 TRINITY_DN3656_c0_g1_i1:294-680(-)
MARTSSTRSSGLVVLALGACLVLAAVKSLSSACFVTPPAGQLSRVSSSTSHTSQDVDMRTSDLAHELRVSSSAAMLGTYALMQPVLAEAEEFVFEQRQGVAQTVLIGTILAGVFIAGAFIVVLNKMYS